MHAPQVIIIALAAATLGISMAKHGEPKDDHNAGMTVIALAVEFTLLALGGFFG